MVKKETVKRWCMALVLCLLMINALYTAVWRFCPSSPATRWLLFYNEIYNSDNG